jgi:hypothetical protein
MYPHGDNYRQLTIVLHQCCDTSHEVHRLLIFKPCLPFPFEMCIAKGVHFADESQPEKMGKGSKLLVQIAASYVCIVPRTDPRIVG